jgi:hypothetical protein
LETITILCDSVLRPGIVFIRWPDIQLGQGDLSTMKTDKMK